MNCKKFFGCLLVLLILSCAGTSNTLSVNAAEWEKKSPHSSHITSVENTPWFILAGENDFFSGSSRHNGLFKSEDFGETWTTFGLEGRGITDIYYNKEKIYITTQFVKNNKLGLFISSDKGKSWQHNTELNFGATVVAAQNDLILLGTGNNGLWVSFDSGTTWEQKIGTGYYGPKIYKLGIGENVLLAAEEHSLYASRDKGYTWNKIPEMEGVRVRHLVIQNNIVLAGAENSSGLYVSRDLGKSWQKSSVWGNIPTGALTFFKGAFYAGKTNPEGNRTVYKTSDLGTTWQDTVLNVDTDFSNVLDLAWIYSVPSYLFAVTHTDGIYRLEIESPDTQELSIFDIPWKHSSKSELHDRITAFFDHEFPLQGYAYHSEESSEGTTLNFMGHEGKEPHMYYSSHNGIDFGLPYGTDVLAPLSGFATYYYCGDCGHSIKIDHQNGLETTYMHLQEEGLITQGYTPLWVEAGTAIGKVGMTGNTTGPHLHFAVTKDKNEDGTFVSEWVTGKFDPFGWQSNAFIDPWENYVWTDILGTHSGVKSTNLWKYKQERVEENATSNEVKEIVLENKKIVFDKDSLNKDFSINAFPYSQVNLSKGQSFLKYIENTSLVIDLYSYAFEKIVSINTPAKIEIDFSSADLSNLNLNSLNIYHYSSERGLWEPLNLVFLDTINRKIIAETINFSQFAVLGEKIDNVPPETSVIIRGAQNSTGWYTEYPEITLQTDEQATSYFKVGNNIDWNIYKTPTVVRHEGPIGVEFKSEDSVGNVENLRETLIKINTTGKTVSTLKITNMQINI